MVSVVCILTTLCLSWSVTANVSVASSQAHDGKGIYEQGLADNSPFIDFSPLLSAGGYFTGSWSINSTQSEVFYKMERPSGDCHMNFMVDNKTNQTNMSVVLEINSYKDSAKVYITINLTNSTYDNMTGTMSMESTGIKPGPFQMRVLERRYGFSTELDQYVPANITLVFRNQNTRLPVDIQTATKPESLETSLKIVFLNEPGELSAEFTFYKGGKPVPLWRYFYVLGALCVMVVYFTGLIKFIRSGNYFIFARTEFLGHNMLCLQLIQIMSFGLMDGIETSSSTISALSITFGVAVCLCSSVPMLIAIFCVLHWLNVALENPNGEFSACRLMTLLSLVFLVVFFLVMGMVFYLNPYVHITVILITSTFPLIHVAETAFRKSHETFQPWIQLGFWPCSLYFSLILRGVGNSFINLTPFPWVGLTQIGIISLGILVSYLQSKHGPRFFLPYSWQSGLLKIRTSANTLTTAEQETECCICYGVLGHPIPTIDNTPQKDDALSTGDDQSDLETRLNSPAERSENPGKDATEWISRPKCGHLYHESCLKSWLVNKQQCPMCKSQIEL